MRLMRSLAGLLAVTLLLSGCGMITVNPERDAAQIVATVNGENITKKQVYNYIGLSFGEPVSAGNLAAVKAQKEQGLEALIYSVVMRQKAKELGFYNFTEDEKKTIDENVNSYTKSIYDSSLANWQEKAKTDSTINPEQKAQEDVNSTLETLGTSVEKLRANEEESLAVEKLRKSITDPVTVSDSDIQTAYDSLILSQKTAYDANPIQLVEDDLSGATIVYYPNADFIRVKHILIKIDDTAAGEIANLRDQEKTDEANAKREEALKAIETKAQEALTKAKAASGNLEELNKLTTDPGEDTGMVDREPGYPTFKGYTGGYVTEFQTAAEALTEVGVPSELVASDFGYHIIWLTQKCPQGNVPLADVKTQFSKTVLSEKQTTSWAQTVDGWVTDTSAKITRYMNRLYK